MATVTPVPAVLLGKAYAACRSIGRYPPGAGVVTTLPLAVVCTRALQRALPAGAALQIFFAFTVVRYGNPDEAVYMVGAAGFVLALLGILAWRRSYPAMVLASILCLAELAVFFWFEGQIDVWNVWRLLFGLGILAWILKRGIDAVRDLNAVRLPIRHPPELIRPLEHHAPPPHSE